MEWWKSVRLVTKDAYVVVRAQDDGCGVAEETEGFIPETILQVFGRGGLDLKPF